MQVFRPHVHRGREDALLLARIRARRLYRRERGGAREPARPHSWGGPGEGRAGGGTAPQAEGNAG